jgi:transcriptional regulator with XRE-family HTH domain
MVRVRFEAPTPSWSAVAEAIRDRRAELGITQAEGIILAGGKVSASTWSHLERGDKQTYERGKLRAVSRALGWSTDSIERIAVGQEPIELSEGQEQELLQRLFRLEETVRDLLVRFQRLEERRQQSQVNRPGDQAPG